MRHLCRQVIRACLVIGLSLLASQTFAQLEEGKQYSNLPASVLRDPLASLNVVDNKIVVTEFFSYGCPACFSVSGPLHEWAKSRPEDVEFQRIPVEFFKDWGVYARAYYTAEVLGILEKMDAPLFNAIHKQRQPLNTKATMRAFFLSHGVSAADFDKTFESFAVDRALERAKLMMKAYHVTAVPTLVVDNRFSTDLQKANGTVGFIAVLEQLVMKARR